MNTKVLLASVAVAVVAAALIGVAAADFAAQNQTAPLWVNSEVEPPCVTGDYSQVPEWCVNATNGEPVWAQNGTAAGYGYCGGWNGAGEGAIQNGNGYGCGVGAQEQYQYLYGGMGHSGTGFGCGW